MSLYMTFWQFAQGLYEAPGQRYADRAGNMRRSKGGEAHAVHGSEPTGLCSVPLEKYIRVV
jgi:hypothetical protein